MLYSRCWFRMLICVWPPRGMPQGGVASAVSRTHLEEEKEPEQASTTIGSASEAAAIA